MPEKPLFSLYALALALGPACTGGSDGADPTVGNTTAQSGTAGSGGVLTSTSTSANSSAGGSGSAGSTTSSTTGSVGTGTGTSSGTAGVADSLFVPDGLSLSKLDGAGEGLNLTALTLLKRPNRTELYAAVKNDGEISACDAAITIEFFDKAEQSLLAWVAGLHSGQLYRSSDGSDALLACLDPGEVGMLGSAELPESLEIEGLGSLVYRFTYFDRDVLPFEVVPVDTISVSQLQSVNLVSGSAFRGTLDNGLDVALNDPSVTIFPLNSVGRPLGMATKSDTIEIAPGGTWMFETSVVNDTGVAHAVYPGASISAE